METRMNDPEFFKEKWTGIGWFRKILALDSSLFGKNMALRMNHYGASEIYLNGKLLKKYGDIDSSETEEGYSPKRIPFIFEPDSAAIQVLAIRYSNRTGLEEPHLFTRFLETMGFQFSFGDSERTIESAVGNVFGNTVINTMISGVFLALFLLYMLLFLFYSRRKVNLYYSIFTLCLSFIFFGNPLKFFFSSGFYPFLVIDIIAVSAFILLFVGYLGFLYSIFYERFPKHGKYLLIIPLLAEIWLFVASTDYMVNFALAIYVLVLGAFGLRVIIVAIMKKKRDAWVIGIGVMAFFFFMVFVVAINVIQIDLSPVFALIIVFTGLLSLPISMSIYLARNVAKTNDDLEQQLMNVKELSAKELEHQKRNSELELQAEKEKAASKEAELRAQTAELQAKASEAQSRVIQAENERKTKELEEARELQLSMLPKVLPEVDFLEIGAYMKTATEVGGDYYDFQLADDGILTAVIGDATGHGLKAGTLVTAAKSLFVSHADEDDVVATMSEFNRSIRLLNFRFLFMCLLMMKISKEKIRFSSAGMPPMLVYRKKDKSVEEILLKGLPLGGKDDFKYEEKVVPIESGDTILLMSDGFPELLNDEGEMFGYENVQKTFMEVAHRGVEEIIEHLKETASKWVDSKDPNDDVTFLLMKVR